ncbi:MAG: DUF6785 family protein [Pyrobaculum sp.]|uniref:DUF6785 family protein n=1 Tax=Pyrobaculum sp. TaxID=2004705 RepID=UPI00317335F2
MAGQASTEVRVEAQRGLTPRVLILSLITIFVLTPVSAMIYFLTDKTGLYQSLMIPYFFIILLNFLVGKVNPRWRLTPPELAILLLPFFAIIGKAYLPIGAGFEGFGRFQINTVHFLIYATNNMPMMPVFRELLPGYIWPKDPTVIEMAWRGKLPGEVVNWGAWTGAIMFIWLSSLTWLLLVIFIVFGIIGYQWVEVERLTFPMAIPTTYIIVRSQENGRTPLFDMKESESRIFWVAFIVGLVIGGAPIMAEVIPAIPVGGAFQWGEMPMDFMFIPAVFGPGAHAHATFIIHQAMLFLLVPFDVLWTGFLIWVIFGLIYQPLGVRMGWLPYQPGVETWSNWWFGYRPPFPYSFFATAGLATGVALYSLWVARDRIRRLFSTIRGADIIEDGLSLRLVAMGLIGSALFFLIFWAAVGVPFVAAILLLLTWFIWQIGHARVMAEVWWHDPCYWAYVFYWLYPAGAGWMWGTEIPTRSAGWLMTNTAITILGEWTPRHFPMSSGFFTNYYYVVRRTRTNLKDAFIISVITAVLCSLIATIVPLWLANHIGLSKSALVGYASYIAGYTSDKGITSMGAFTIPNEHIAAWTVIGILTALALYFIRMRWPAFIINPVAAIPAFWLMEFMWLASLVALVVKIVLVRALGAARFERYVTPIAAGVAIGYGALVIVPMFFHIATTIIPRFAALYVP